MPFFILSLIIQLAFVVHIVRTGRNTNWIWVVALLPVVGSLAYLVLEMLPEISGNRPARKPAGFFKQKARPNKKIKAAAQAFATTITVEHSLKLAQQRFNKGLYEDAKTLYESALTGIHENDPEILFGLARAEFMLSNFKPARLRLEELKEKNPGYVHQEAHLLYARSVENLGDAKKALTEYAALVNYYTGAEAKYRYAILLNKEGEKEKGEDILRNVIQASYAAGKHFILLNREWIILAKKALRAENT